jgi:DNA-binding LytR/AlgR family response regulator
MKLRCLVIDDEPLARKIIEEYINELDFLHHCASVENPLEAYKYLDECMVDMIFLDIDMPKISGIEFLKNSKKLPPVIITTAHSKYAVESYQFDVIDYLLKPVTFEQFFKAVHKAKDFIELNRQLASKQKIAYSYIFIKSGNKHEKLYLDDLLYAEAQSNYIMLHTKTRKMMTYLTMNSLLQNLPADDFVQIHKSYIVSIGKIDKLDSAFVYINNKELPISRTYKDDFLKIIRKRSLNS